ncbi:lipopolysaccharide biosynthesis protein [Sphingomonas profundi]|uniref:lipopolysaccharide biosynthesis protein n=1 Tax=Alterirhizorhabdus profundi TaxID=2681549 RepID=UPI0012E72037|nr:lipopolysaccharide biosynthesis protein [Sphingomonas profundi]
MRLVDPGNGRVPEAAMAPPAPPRRTSLKRDAAWTAIDTIVSAGLAFLFRLVMARFLVPAEFGVFAMALTTFAVVQVINEFGMAATVIQRAEDKFTDAVVDTAFAASTFVSLGLFVINLAVIAPISAWVYGSERVGIVTAVIGISFLFTPTVSIARALLFRRRDYRAVTIARIVSTIASIVVASIVLVLLRNVWALAVQVVASQVFLAIAMHYVGNWRPRFRFSRGAFREMIGYSGLVFANDLFVSVARNFDVITLGRMLSQSQVGLYSLAFYITDVARQNLMSVLNRVMFTHYATIQNDPAAMRFYYVRSLFYNCLVLFPVMIAIILFGPSLTVHFLGAKWQAMGVTLQILAVSVMIHASGGTTSTVYKALGKPGLDLALFALTSVVFLLPALIAGTYHAGIMGAAIAIASNKLVATVIRQFYLNRLLGTTTHKVLRAVALALLFQVPIVLLALISRAAWPSGDWLRELLVGGVALGGYFAALGAYLYRAKGRANA